MGKRRPFGIVHDLSNLESEIRSKVQNILHEADCARSLLRFRSAEQIAAAEADLDNKADLAKVLEILDRIVDHAADLIN